MRALALSVLLLVGCDDAQTAEVDTQPSPIATTSCEVCGMVVAEQPAPRGQLVYRDGTRAHFCSLGELRATVQGRSPHGSPVALYVEALPADFDPAANATAEQSWIPAEGATYLTGATRPMVMGLPLLSFADGAEAQEAATRLGLGVATWPDVRDTPFNALP
jgi:copper chaperone NosL